MILLRRLARRVSCGACSAMPCGGEFLPQPIDDPQLARQRLRGLN